MSSNVLSPRDSNAQMKPASPEKKVAKSLDVHREELQAKLNSNDTTQQYISPSDSIQSPATQKLAAMRNKHILKKGKPKTLFEATSSKKLASANGAPLFADFAKQTKKNTTPAGEAVETTGQNQADPVFSRDLNKSPVFKDALPVATAQAVATSQAASAPADPERGAPAGDEPKDA